MRIIVFMNNAIIETAKNLGIKAFENGKMRVSGWDAQLMEMVSMQTDSKAKCGLMAAWLKGWDSCLVTEMMAA